MNTKPLTSTARIQRLEQYERQLIAAREQLKDTELRIRLQKEGFEEDMTPVYVLRRGAVAISTENGVMASAGHSFTEQELLYLLECVKRDSRGLPSTNAVRGKLDTLRAIMRQEL